MSEVPVVVTGAFAVHLRVMLLSDPATTDVGFEVVVPGGACLMGPLAIAPGAANSAAPVAPDATTAIRARVDTRIVIPPDLRMIKMSRQQSGCIAAATMALGSRWDGRTRTSQTTSVTCRPPCVKALRTQALAATHASPCAHHGDVGTVQSRRTDGSWRATSCPGESRSFLVRAPLLTCPSNLGANGTDSIRCPGFHRVRSRLGG